METPIHDYLEQYAQSGTLRLHMPGGKGIGYPNDITEISGADVLYECDGIIRESERNAASLFGAADTCYSCGGSTLSIQAMLAAACEITGKRRIAAGRYSHKSLVSAAILLGIDIDFIYPGSFLGADITPDAADAAITQDTAAVFVNSVDYLGGQSDIAAISEVCRKRGVMLLVDNAHGAYKVFTGDHPITLGADMTADSAHKTLPAITGTSYLHLAHSEYYRTAKAEMSLFGSSSPSYLMLDSLDLCNRYISEKKSEALDTVDRAGKLKAKLRADGWTLFESDAMRITIDANAAGYTGVELGIIIRNKGAECEMCGEKYAVMLFSVIQPESDFTRVNDIMSGIPKKTPLMNESLAVIRPEKVMTLRDAYFSVREKLPVSRSVGRVCADICSPCPPCVPIIMPGERISAEAAEMLIRYGVEEIRVMK